MAEKIKLVRNDTRPAIVVTITNETTGLPINITGATPRLKFRAAGATVLTATLEGTVTNGPIGECAFFPAAYPQMLSGEAGDYEGEIEVTYSDGQIQTVYDILKFKVREDF
jgi:hypothetical protein